MKPDAQIHIRLLSFDFGLKRIGVAYGQMITKTARPLLTLDAKNGVPNWQQVQSIINDWEVDTLIVGIPYNMDGSEQPITKKAREFADSLHKETNLSVFFCDERLTTIEARSDVFAAGGFKALKHQKIDAVAAKIILESWMHEK